MSFELRILFVAISMFFLQGCVNSLAYRLSVCRGYAKVDLYPGTKYDLEFIAKESLETRARSEREFKNPLTWVLAPVFTGADFIIDTVFLIPELAFYDYSASNHPILTACGEGIYTLYPSKECLWGRAVHDRIDLHLKLDSGYVDFIGTKDWKRLAIWDVFMKVEGKKNLRLIPPTYTPDSWYSGPAECTWLTTDVGSNNILGYAIALRLSVDSKGELTIRQPQDRGDLVYVITNGMLQLAK